MELLPFVSRSYPPSFVRGHRGGATQHSDAEEDRPVSPRKGKTLDTVLILVVIHKQSNADESGSEGEQI